MREQLTDASFTSVTVAGGRPVANGIHEDDKDDEDDEDLRQTHVVANDIRSQISRGGFRFTRGPRRFGKKEEKRKERQREGKAITTAQQCQRKGGKEG